MDESNMNENKIDENNIDENNIKQDKTNNLKKKNIIITILLIVIVLSLIIAYMLISKPTEKKENGNKENESKEKEDKDKEEIKEKDFYIIYYKDECLYGIKEDASTETLACNIINKFTTYDTYDNNLYYIDQNHYAHELDLHTLKDTNLNIKTSEEYNWNLYAGKDFFILTEVKIANKYNLKDGKEELLPIKSTNTVYIDSEDNIYYTGEDNVLYCYNLNTKKTTVIAKDGRVIEGTGNIFWYASGTIQDGEELYIYNTETKKSTKFEDIERTGNGYTLIYNDKFIMTDKNEIITLSDNKKEVITSFDNIDRIASIHLLNDKILVNTAIDDYSVCKPTDCICGPDVTYTSYLVDINTKEVKKLENDYGFLTESLVYIYV